MRKNKISGTTLDVGQTRSDSVTIHGETQKQNVSLEVFTSTTMKMNTTLPEDSKTIQVKLSNLPEGLDYNEIQTNVETGKAVQSMLL